MVHFLCAGDPTTRFGAQVALLPWTFSSYLYWSLRWCVLFWLRGQPYGDEEAAYLTRRAMGCTNEQWTRIPPQARLQFMSRELWIKENMLQLQEEQREAFKRQNPDKYKRYARAKKRYRPDFGAD